MTIHFIILLFLPLYVFSDTVELQLGNRGSIRYTYDDMHLLQVDRLSVDKEILYSHSYTYSEEGRLLSENLIGGLGTIVYGKELSVSPYHQEVCEYNGKNQLIRHTIDGDVREYSYTNKGALDIDPIDIPYEYDDKGNLIFLGDVYYTYDDHHHLIGVKTPSHEVVYGYDAVGKRVSKTVNGVMEKYKFFGINEISIHDEKGNLQQLCIPGLSSYQDIIRPIAIETKDAVYAPIFDIQGNIIKLVDMETKEVTVLNRADPFGKDLSSNSAVSWIFANKHYDPEVQLAYFGARFYSPILHKWLTPDPDRQSFDLYQYCFNNPFAYRDPDGRFAFLVPFFEITWGAGVAITCPAWAPYALAGAASAYVINEGYEYYKKRQERLDHNENPPYTGDKALGIDAEKCPGKGYRWKGNGAPKTHEGNWVKGEGDDKEQLHPDFNSPCHDPHWDYYGPKFSSGVRIYPDGSWEYKKP